MDFSVLSNIVQEAQKFLQSPNVQEYIRKTINAFGPGVIIEVSKKIEEFFKKTFRS